MKIEAQEIRQRDSFRFPGWKINKGGEIGEHVKHRIRAGWLKWRLASGVLCDHCMSPRFKEKLYKTSIRLTMTYGSGC